VPRMNEKIAREILQALRSEHHGETTEGSEQSRVERPEI
jgi:hypothetical protein